MSDLQGEADALQEGGLECEQHDEEERLGDGALQGQPENLPPAECDDRKGPEKEGVGEVAGECRREAGDTPQPEEGEKVQVHGAHRAVVGEGEGVRRGLRVAEREDRPLHDLPQGKGKECDQEEGKRGAVPAVPLFHPSEELGEDAGEQPRLDEHQEKVEPGEDHRDRGENPHSLLLARVPLHPDFPRLGRS